MGIQILVILIALVVGLIPTLISAGITRGDARRQQVLNENGILIQREPKQFETIIMMETLRTVAMGIGTVAFVIAAGLIVIDWRSYGLAGGILAAAAILCWMTGMVLSKKASKRRGQLRVRLSMGEPEKLGVRELLEQMPTEMEEQMNANLRIRQVELQALDMLVRRDGSD